MAPTAKDTRNTLRMGDNRGGQRRGAGRHSTVVRYEREVDKWLQKNPALSGARILQRARLAGYRGGKSAFYELVRRLRYVMQESVDSR